MNDTDTVLKQIEEIIFGHGENINDRALARQLKPEDISKVAHLTEQLADNAKSHPYTFLRLVTQVPGRGSDGLISQFVKSFKSQSSVYHYFTGKAKTIDMLLAVDSPAFSFDDPLAKEVIESSELTKDDYSELNRLIHLYSTNEHNFSIKNLLNFLDKFHPKDTLSFRDAGRIVDLACNQLKKAVRDEAVGEKAYLNSYRLRLSDVLFELYSRGYISEDVLATLTIIPAIDSTLFADAINSSQVDLNRITQPNKCLMLAVKIEDEPGIEPIVTGYFDRSMGYLRSLGYDPAIYEANMLKAIENGDISAFLKIKDLPGRYLTYNKLQVAFIKRHGWHNTPSETECLDLARLRLCDKTLGVVDRASLSSYGTPGPFNDIINHSCNIREIFHIASKSGLYSLEAKQSLNALIAGMLKPGKIGMDPAGNLNGQYYCLDRLTEELARAGVIEHDVKVNGKAIIRALLESRFFDNDKKSPVIYADNILVTLAENQDEKMLKYAVSIGYDLERPTMIAGRTPARAVSNLPDEGANRTAYALRSEHYRYESFLDYLLYTNARIEAHIYNKRRRDKVLGRGCVSATQKLLNEALSLVAGADRPLTSKEAISASLSGITFNQLQLLDIPVDMTALSNVSEYHQNDPDNNDTKTYFASPLCYLLSNEGHILNQKISEDRWWGEAVRNVLLKGIEKAVVASGDPNPVIAAFEKINGEYLERRLNDYVSSDEVLAFTSRLLLDTQANASKPARRAMKL